MKIRTIIEVAAVVSGFVLLVTFAPSAFQESGAKFRLDYPLARQLSADAVRSFWKSDISTWRMRLEPALKNRYSLRMWQDRYGKSDIDYIATADAVKLTFNGPGKQPDYFVTLAGNGRIIELDRKTARRAANDQDGPIDQAAIAQNAFRLLTGELSSQFRQQETTPLENGMKEFRWTAGSTHPSMSWDVAVRVDKSALRTARLTPRIEEDERVRLLKPVGPLGDTALVVTGVTVFTGGTIVVIVCIFAGMRKLVDRKAFFIASGLMFAIGVLPSYMGNPNGGHLVQYFFICLLFGAALAVGQISARETEWEQWRGMRLVLGGYVRARGIWVALAWGALWSGILACIPIVIQGSGLFPDTHMGVLAWSLQILNRIPGLSPLAGIWDPKTVTLFGVLLPWLTNRLGVRSVGIVLFACLAALLGFYSTPFASGLQAAITCSLITTVLTLALYLRHGLLAVMGASLFAEMLTLAALFWNSPSPFLQRNGVWILALLAGCTALILIALRFSKEVEPVDMMAERFLSNRERLKAAFSMAQQAQQRLLPAEAPRVPNFSIATSCHPAKDVGGDLFDYFRLADGRFGFCVADVSGKGMPAALYMTLTKGLLAAASPEAKGLSDLTRRVNRHLHIACKRKMFVTAAFAAVDAESRTVEYLRAGHNPALLLEAATGKARYLVTPGVGLGLAGPAVFDRGARTEQYPLSPGDLMVFYSDGVTEAMNDKLELYGEERFQAVLERIGSRPAQDVLEAIRKDLSAFMGSEPPHDDITLLVLQTI